MGFDNSSEKKGVVTREMMSKKDRRAKPFGELDLSRFKIESGYWDHLMKERPSTKPDYSKVKEDWAYMNASLKQGTYVRACYPDRVDLLRVMIVGPAGTPYHDGLMFYDLQHSPNFPYNPPMVYDYYLLTRPGAILTWEEVIDRIKHKDHHKYNVKEQEHTACRDEKHSIMLMIEYLEKCVLQERRGPGSKLQNAEEFIKSCYQMVKVIDDPPMYFEDIVYNHFRVRGKFILEAIKAYSSGMVQFGKYNEHDSYSFDDTLQDSERTSIIELFQSAKLESYLTDAIKRNEQQGPKKRNKDSSRASGSSTKEEMRHPKNPLKRLFSRVIKCGNVHLKDDI